MCALQRLRLVTMQRGGELAKLQWADVDLEAGWLAFPPSVTKNKKPHRVPLLALIVWQAIPRNRLVMAGVVLAMCSLGVLATWIQRSALDCPMILMRDV